MHGLRALPLLAGLLVGGPAAAADPVSAALFERLADRGRVMVIVELDETTIPEGWLARARDRQDQRRRVLRRQIDAIYALGGSDAGAVQPYDGLPYLAVEVGPRALRALARSGLVRRVRESQVYAPSLGETLTIVGADQTAAIGFDGAGQTLVVLDTGTDGGHENFPPGKIVAEACFADGATASGSPQGGGQGDCPGGGDTAFGAGSAVPCDFADDCFHGTHVAGIAAGSGPTLPGVAPAASLIPVQIFSQFPASHPSCEGSICPLTWEHDQDAALAYVYGTLRHSHTIASVNMSLGGGTFTSDCDIAHAATKAIVDNLRSVGIATVVATGNNGCAGTGCTDAIAAPACISSTISVSATRDNDFVASFANRSALTTFFAPGQTVRAPLYGTLGQFQNASGTSMAAPHVAAAFAILRQASGAASVSSMVAALESTGEPIQLGIERIDVRDALGTFGYPECDDGIDNDGDGTVDGDDPGCDDPADAFERSGALPCDDGVDNDSDGLVDQDDPGCFSPGWPAEDPACDDGIDNDGDLAIDWNGSPADPQCSAAYLMREAQASSCGLGAELVLLLPALLRLRRRRTR